MPGQPMSGQSTAGQPMSGQSTEGQALAAQAVAAQLTGDQWMEGHWMPDEAVVAQPMAAQLTGEQWMESDWMSGQPVGDQWLGDQWMSGLLTVGQPMPGQPTATQPTGDQAQWMPSQSNPVHEPPSSLPGGRPPAVAPSGPSCLSRSRLLPEAQAGSLGLTEWVVLACAAHDHTVLTATTSQRMTEVMSKALVVMRAVPARADFRSCPWNSLYLAGLVCSRLPEHQGWLRAFADVIPRPPALTDSWYLACVLELDSDARHLARQLAAAAGVNCVDAAERLFCETFAPAAHVCAPLPSRAEALQLTCAFSKLEYLLTGPGRTLPWELLEHREPVKGQRLLPFLKRVLGPAACSKVTALLRDRLPPPASWFRLRNERFLTYVLECALSPWDCPREPTHAARNGEAQTQSRGSEAAPTPCRGPKAAQVEVLIPPPAPGPVAYMKEVLAECATTEAEERRRWSVAQREQWAKARHDMASLAVTKLWSRLPRAVAATASEPWLKVGWRWVSLAGMLHDVYGSEQVLALAKKCEMEVARPSGVSPLWYLAELLRRYVSNRLIARRLNGWRSRGVELLDWECYMPVYHDNFPTEFGQLPNSEASRTLVCVASRTLHWVIHGSERLGAEPASQHERAVESIYRVLGARRCKDLVAVFRPQVAAVGDSLAHADDRCFLGCMLKNGGVVLECVAAFCDALPPPDQNSHQPELPPKNGVGEQHEPLPHCASFSVAQNCG
ncbi:hypothetical protein GNI_012060 [Gregarina niphandrodes]|uniref:Uncharacterized protein n=1 Tax=Gregarina niphandrodes TaxID=110365 RepID=A0A023BCS1_GRENI|nr:hypothetical protein GNI_012060 [Gregarina niphandrodes]EZG85046.1 hypothetical protein GNI_012060 [Gregarina niphandrodes]|eukprot:XP_011128839.1 hypothetical protein GNI_012060 [Gregarina niphandrodes]